MAYIKNTAFEVYVTNSKRNDTQNITGKFGSFTGETFTRRLLGRLPLYATLAST